MGGAAGGPDEMLSALEVLGLRASYFVGALWAYPPIYVWPEKP